MADGNENGNRNRTGEIEMTETTETTDATGTTENPRREWGGMILETRRLYGHNGLQNGRRGASGSKIHALDAEVVVGLTAPAKPGTYAAAFERERRAAERAIGHHVERPVFFSVVGLCGANGQHTGRPVRGATIDDVSCSRCRKRLGLDG